MKKIFTLFAVFAVAAMAFTASAEKTGSQIIYYNASESLNTLTGDEIGATNGWTLTCQNSAKNYQNGKNFTIDGQEYKSLKLSNGAQNKLDLPEGLYATKLTIYSTINKDEATDRACYWKEIAGTEYTLDANNGIINSFKDYENPDVQSFNIVPAKNSITFTNTGEQPFVVLVVEYSDDATSGIADIVTDENAPVEYFNLQGVRVENPANGLYIKRQGSQVSKVIVK